MNDIMDLMKNLPKLKEMKEKFENMQAQLAKEEVVGASGADLVQVTLTGDFQVKDIKLDPIVLTDQNPEVLQTLLKSAFNDGLNKIKEKMSSFGKFPL